MSERDSARHRAPQRALSPLTDVSDAVTGSFAVVGRSSAVLAVSTGLLATGGMVSQASGASTTTLPVTSAPDAARTGFTPMSSGGLFSTGPVAPNRAGLSAPIMATVSFEPSAFTAEPGGTRRSARRVTHTHAGAPQAEPAAPAGPVEAPAKARTKHVSAPVTTVTKTPASHARTTHATAPAKTTQKKTTQKKTTHTKTTHAKVPARKVTTKQGHTSTKPAGHASVPTSSTRGSSVLAIASRYVGTPYRYGGTSPRGFDCSGFTGYVYRQLGVHLPRTANEQMLATHRITRSQARAGDLVFFVSGHHAYHVAIYAGNGMIYDSPRAGKSVSKRAIWSATIVFGRITG